MAEDGIKRSEFQSLRDAINDALHEITRRIDQVMTLLIERRK